MNMCVIKCHINLLLLVFLAIFKHVVTEDIENKSKSCFSLYEEGKHAYLENNFQLCVEKLQKSIEKYKAFTKSLENCRIKCKEEAEHSDPLYPINIENLNFYEKTIRNTLCIIKCRKSNEIFKETPSLTAEHENEFQIKKPYEYLHICYFQTKQFQKAASAAFTYLVANPQDENIIKTFKYYLEHPEVSQKDVVNFEAEEYVYLYVHGVNAYDKKDWDGVEHNMENSLFSYLQTEEECRAHCEGPFVQDWFPDFIPGVANHFTFCLKCKRNCSAQLNNLNGEYHEDLLPSHYHYLQYAYYKNGNLKAACQAAASFMLFYPDDEVMRTNIEFYKKVPKTDVNYFTPRKEAVKYIRRNTYELKLLKFITTEYNFTSPEPIKEIPVKEEPSTINQQNDVI